jgi:eukaryotic translation initiation factor 2-alpha kinase 4
VGTYFYRPPEDVGFTEKVDVYSLGVILFEMWHNFKNGHERVKILNQLRSTERFPKQFETHHKR